MASSLFSSVGAELAVHGKHVLLFLATMGIGDILLHYAAPRLRVARWKVLHALANLMVAILSLKDSLTTVKDPINSCNGSFAWLLLCVIVVSHPEAFTSGNVLNLQ